MTSAMPSLRSRLMTRGATGESFKTWVMTSAKDVPWNGGWPVAMWYRVAPSE